MSFKDRFTYAASALAVILSCAALTGCGTLGQGTTGAAASAVLGNLEHCEREYSGSLGLTGALVVNIKCPGKPYETGLEVVLPKAD